MYLWITLVVIIYAGLFGPEATNEIIIGWFMSLGLALGIIEPLIGETREGPAMAFPRAVIKSSSVPSTPSLVPSLLCATGKQGTAVDAKS